MIKLIPTEEFKKVRSSKADKYLKLEILADMARVNTLSIIKNSGSGHIGSSLSSTDIVTYLYNEVLTVKKDDPNRDIYFSSKGHDVPALYTVLHSLGLIETELLLKFRKLNGLHGHPDISNPYMEANTGSLGMGISKARGMAFAKKIRNYKGHVYVMTGDGELQEGQIYEALQTTANQEIGNLTVIIDNNKIQTDRYVSELIDSGNFEERFSSFGWRVLRCNGHNFEELENVFEEVRVNPGYKPFIIIADTVKGKGIDFMEDITKNRYYQWHSGSPENQLYLEALKVLENRINNKLGKAGLGLLKMTDISPLPPEKTSETENLPKAYGKKLCSLAEKRKDIFVLDADLAEDCGVRPFEEKFPERFIENGIAEQDMVSMAGGMAKMGLLPVVNSFAAFLVSKANEQIYNNASENTKIIYACNYAGLIPAAPGKSHQSIRDISLLGTIPNMQVIQPCNAAETEKVIEYCVTQAGENCAVRLQIGNTPGIVKLPENYQFCYGTGTELAEGDEALLFAYGPVMLNEALKLHDILSQNDFAMKVINMPWLNRVNQEWLKALVTPYRYLFVTEDHSVTGGLGDFLLRELNRLKLMNNRKIFIFGPDSYPACGSTDEVLDYHGLSAEKLKQRILKTVFSNKK